MRFCKNCDGRAATTSSGTIVRPAHNSRTGTRGVQRAYTSRRSHAGPAHAPSRLQRSSATYAAATPSASLRRGGPNEFAETTRSRRILRYVVKGALEMNRSRGRNGSAGTFLEGTETETGHGAPGLEEPLLSVALYRCIVHCVHCTRVISPTGRGCEEKISP